MVDKFTEGKQRRPKSDAIQLGATEALYKLLAPIVDFALDAGLGINAVQSIFRVTAVRRAASRQIEGERRVSISGIAAITGVSRAEISRIIKPKALVRRLIVERGQQPISRILAAWRYESKFKSRNGQPADLIIFGPGKSFDSLAKTHGRGIPTRAILDELIRAGFVELIAEDAVRIKARSAVNPVLNLDAVNEFGDRSAELLVAMLSNIRNPHSHQLIANVKGSVESADALDLLRREILAKSAELISGTKEMFLENDTDGRQKSSRPKSQSISLTVMYWEKPAEKPRNSKSAPRRRNMRRSR